MKISFWSIGKNHEAYVKPGIEEFSKRINRYFKLQWNLIPVPKNAGMLSEMDLRKREAETIMEWLEEGDYLVALDERGKQFDSENLADFIQSLATDRVKNLVFLIGGVYGLDESILK